MDLSQTDASQNRQTRTPPKDRRRIVDAVLYLVKCGCPWRYLPADFPNWKTVYHVFRQWIASRRWAVIHDTLRVLVRRANGKRSRPTAAVLDSQSVKSAGHGGRVGYDAGKRIKGRKRHLLVDTLGLILGVTVTPASTTERDGAQLLLKQVLGWFAWLRILWVDGAYSGDAFAQWVKGLFAPNWPWRWSNVPTPTRASRCCRIAGLWSGPLAG